MKMGAEKTVELVKKDLLLLAAVAAELAVSGECGTVGKWHAGAVDPFVGNSSFSHKADEGQAFAAVED
jgi:hypothetical protein